MVGCGAPQRGVNVGLGLGWASEVENRSISRFMDTAVSEVAMGDDDRWNEIAKIWSEHRLNGIGATCFLAGLGELFARAPTVFLERHLAGDQVAKDLAREGYNLLFAKQIVGERGFNPELARRNALAMFNQRWIISDDQTRRSTSLSCL